MKAYWILFFIIINAIVVLSLPQAPDFSVKTYDGKTLSYSDLRGKVIILVFYQYYCPHCRVEIPRLSSSLSNCDGNYVVLMDGLGGDVSNDYDFFLSNAKENWFFIPEDFDLARKYGVSGVPTIVVIDANGNIFKIISGESDESYCDLVIAAGGMKAPTNKVRTPSPTSISINIEMSHPDEITVEGKLYSGTLGVPNRTVKISLDNVEKWVLTDLDGQFFATMNVSRLPDGNYTIKITFPGDQDFSASETSKIIRIERNISVKLPSQLIDIDRNRCFYIALNRNLDNISFIGSYDKFNFTLERINETSYKICAIPVEEFFGNLSLKLNVKSGNSNENVTVFLIKNPPEEILNMSAWIERKIILKGIIDKMNGTTSCENLSERCMTDLLIARKAGETIKRMYSDVSCLLDSLQERNLTRAYKCFTLYSSEAEMLRDAIENVTHEVKLNMSRYVGKGEFISFDIPLLSNEIEKVSIYIEQDPSPQLLLGVFGKPEGSMSVSAGGLMENYNLEWDYGYHLLIPRIYTLNKKLHIDINFKSLGCERWIFVFPVEMRKARIDITITIVYNNISLVNYVKALFPYQ